jgi:CheY-like chemotaxis protein
MRNTGADILVVDDEADIRELVSGLLEDEGHSVRVAANSDQALAAIRARKRASASSSSLQAIRAWATKMSAPRMVGNAGLRAMAELARVSVQQQRYAQAAVVVREALSLAWGMHIERSWPSSLTDDFESFRVGADTSLKELGKPGAKNPTKVDKQLAALFVRVRDHARSLRNDLSHAGMRAEPWSSTQVAESTQELVATFDALIQATEGAKRG